MGMVLLISILKGKCIASLPNICLLYTSFEVSIEKVYDLDPTRIESMTILKDAAATAIYGSRTADVYKRQL